MRWFVFAQKLKEIRRTLRDEGLLYNLPWHQDMGGCVMPWKGAAESSIDLCDSLGIDDASLMMKPADADSAIGALASTAGALIDACLRRGLRASLSVNKTEAMVAVKGKSSRSIRQERSLVALQAPGRGSSS